MQSSARYGEQTGPTEKSRGFDVGFTVGLQPKQPSVPSVVLIKKTVHVEIKQQQQQAVCIFRGAYVHEWGQKSAFLEW